MSNKKDLISHYAELVEDLKDITILLMYEKQQQHEKIHNRLLNLCYSASNINLEFKTGYNKYLVNFFRDIYIRNVECDDENSKFIMDGLISEIDKLEKIIINKNINALKTT